MNSKRSPKNMISSGFKFDKEPAEEFGLLDTYTPQS